MRAELLVFLLVLATSELAAAGAGALASGSDGAWRKLHLGNRAATETSLSIKAASAQGERQPAFQSAKRGPGSRGVRPTDKAAATGGGTSKAATRVILAERQTLSISIDPEPGTAATIAPTPAAAEAGRSQLPASAPTSAGPLPRSSAPQPAEPAQSSPQSSPPPSPIPQPSPPQFILADDGYYFFEGTGPAVLTPAKRPASRPPPKPPTAKKPVVRKSPAAKKSPKPLVTPSLSPSPGGGPDASGKLPNPVLPPNPPDFSSGPTVATPSTVPGTDPIPVPSPSPVADGQTDDRQAELPALPQPLASPRPPPLAPPPPLVPPPGTTSGAWPLPLPVPLPAQWDSRDKRLTAGVNVVSRVRFQASCNACVAFTVIAAAESAYALGARRAATYLDFSEQALFFCNNDIAARPPDCNAGWVLPDALHVLSQRGVRQERCYVYDVTRGAAVCGPAGAEERDTLPGGEDANSSSGTSSGTSGSGDNGSSSGNGSSTPAAAAAPSVCDSVPGRWEVVAREWYGVESANATAAKEMVAGTGSAMTCFKLYADMYSHPGGVYRWDGESAWLGWHCAQLVGWSDDGGWWLFKSSWGTEVADKGFFKVAYDEAEVLAWGVYGLIWRP